MHPHKRILSNAYLPGLMLALCLFTMGCGNYRKLIRDEIVLFNGTSHTGTILSCDSTRITLKKSDLSRQVVMWEEIDTVQCLGYKTGILSFHTGIHSTPYYSVFRDENFEPVSLGFQLRLGSARMGKTYRYGALSILPGKPYRVTKLGLGFQRYIRSKYVDTFAFYAGLESSLMFVRNNNAPQITIEPFLGGEYKLADQFRLSARLGFHKNLLSMNPSLGVNLCVGINFLFRNFAAHYDYINQKRMLPAKYNP